MRRTTWWECRKWICARNRVTTKCFFFYNHFLTFAFVSIRQTARFDLFSFEKVEQFFFKNASWKSVIGYFSRCCVLMRKWKTDWKFRFTFFKALADRSELKLNFATEKNSARKNLKTHEAKIFRSFMCFDVGFKMHRLNAKSLLSGCCKTVDLEKSMAVFMSAVCGPLSSSHCYIVFR